MLDQWWVIIRGKDKVGIRDLEVMLSKCTLLRDRRLFQRE